MALMRKEESTPPAASIAVGQTHTILGPESSFDGKLTFKGAVRIDGKFSGEVATDDVLVVGEGAEVTATLEVGSLILNGTVRGNVFAKKAIELHAPAHLYGDIHTPSLVINHGVVFEGNCKMENLGKRNEVLKDGNKAPPVVEGKPVDKPKEGAQKSA
jgi:cytoskeletal protein CcmA (bactofilin family)